MREKGASAGCWHGLPWRSTRHMVHMGHGKVGSQGRCLEEDPPNIFCLEFGLVWIHKDE